MTSEGKISCSFTVPSTHYFIQEFEYGPDSRQPHNFITMNDEDIAFQVFQHHTEVRSYENEFSWLSSIGSRQRRETSDENKNSLFAVRTFEPADKTVIIIHA